MSFIVFLILTFFWGLIVGAFARLALPGPDPMSLFQTALLGIAGSLVAGIVVLAAQRRALRARASSPRSCSPC